VRRLLLVLVVLLVPRLAAAQPETIEYYGTDTIGSIRIVWDANGTVLGRQDYAPFGKTQFTVPTMPKEGFTAQEKDDETDQAYFHARMFEARTGRFTRPDPVFSAMDNPQALNRYAYALNRPMEFTDPSGLNAFQGSSNPGCETFPIECSQNSWSNWFWISSNSWAGSGGWGGGSWGDRGGGGIVVQPPANPNSPPSNDSGSPPDPKPGPNPGPTPSPDDCTTPARARWIPDYFTYQANIALPNPVTGSFVGVNVQVTIDQNANVYLGGGGSIGKSATLVAGSFVFGWLDGSGPLSSSKLTAFVSGQTTNSSAGFGGGIGRTDSPGNGRATEVGFFTPQWGASTSYSWRLFNLNRLSGAKVCK
jgi:RHS repeat-associated protein